MNPLVSICCLTYNHGNYIRDAIEGFLMQKTSFPYEIIIHDDASTDNTVQVIKEFADINKDKIIPILQVANQFSKGFDALLNFVFSRAKGKYLALCEGDDYWTHPLKLQKQVDFLETNVDCTLCFHASKHVFADDPNTSSIHRPSKIPANSKFDIRDCILGGGGFITTNSMCFLSKYANENPTWRANAPVGDLPLMLLLGSKGKIGYIDEVMSVYRRMTENSWSRTMQHPLKLKSFYIAIDIMWKQFDKYTAYKYHSYILRARTQHKKTYYRHILKKSFLCLFTK